MLVQWVSGVLSLGVGSVRVLGAISVADCAGFKRVCKRVSWGIGFEV